MFKERKTGRRRLWRVAGVMVLLAGFSAGGAVVAPGAVAAPSCAAGYVCMWTKSDGGGDLYKYERQSNHTLRVASVHYNYSKLSISFWKASDGRGDRITGYTTAQRGFRNWSSGNWDACRSHRDYFG